ncbi:hypothetical protein HPB50_003779 [Hyalomma asiaticum]|uniref:Uncharacterized protein n=1 Tax=Hyalomma asiaticum TaxID=266040 RepID=A0ACB7S421_HYAAI|nr:hypothetical protein HPB50_003779 [Hyalomma asiaticum]
MGVPDTFIVGSGRDRDASSERPKPTVRGDRMKPRVHRLPRRTQGAAFRGASITDAYRVPSRRPRETCVTFFGLTAGTQVGASPVFSRMFADISTPCSHSSTRGVKRLTSVATLTGRPQQQGETGARATKAAVRAGGRSADTRSTVALATTSAAEAKLQCQYGAVDREKPERMEEAMREKEISGGEQKKAAWKAAREENKADARARKRDLFA